MNGRLPPQIGRKSPTRRSGLRAQRVWHRRRDRRQGADRHQLSRAGRHRKRPTTTSGSRASRIAAKVKAADPWLDLAVLEIEAERPRSRSPFGDARDLKKGQFVIALGNPYAIARDGQPSAAWGIVSQSASGKRRRREPARGPASGRETLHHWGTLIQTDARLELGTSGGALVNLKGEMVGLTTSLAALAGYERPGGFAFPVDDDFPPCGGSHSKSGGCRTMDFSASRRRHLAGDERQRGRAGALVDDVVPATPAAPGGAQGGRRHHARRRSADRRRAWS